MSKKFFVVSDLHVGSGKLDGFDVELENAFVDFVVFLMGRHEPNELIFNGDFFEFIQADPYEVPKSESVSIDGVPLCHTQETSINKLRRIIAEHPKLFQALRDFLHSYKENKITIIPGNHDVDLFWNAIQEILKTTIAGEDVEFQRRISFSLGSHYSPSDLPYIWIEHGNKYDPANRFKIGDTYFWGIEKKPILNDRDGIERLIECPGTKLLIRYLNKIMENEDCHNIKYIKPIYLILFWGTSLLESGEGPLKLRAAITHIVRTLLNTDGFKAKEMLKAKAPSGSQDIIDEIIQRLTIKGEKDLKERIQLHQSLGSFLRNSANREAFLEKLACEPELLDDIDLIDKDSSSSLMKSGIKEIFVIPEWINKFFKRNNEDMLSGHAKDIINAGNARFVVMGHTHEIIEDHKIGYFNPGCLTRRFSMEYSAGVAKWDYLKKSEISKFSFQLRYVEIDPLANPIICIKKFNLQ